MLVPQIDDRMLLNKSMFDMVGLLLEIRGQKFIPFCKCGGITGFKPDDFISGFFHLAVVKGHLQSGCKIDISVSTGIGIPVGHSYFRTPGNGVIIISSNSLPWRGEAG